MTTKDQARARNKAQRARHFAAMPQADAARVEGRRLAKALAYRKRVHGRREAMPAGTRLKLAAEVAHEDASG